MPDKRHHRGQHPEDGRLFAAERVADLRSAVADLSLLLSRGDAQPSALSQAPEIVATADSVILDRCQHWFCLACEVVRRVPDAYVIDLRDGAALSS